MLGIFPVIYLYQFTLAAVPLWAHGDYALHLVNAVRILQGEVMYRDFFWFVTPGTELVYLPLFAVFGLHTWLPGALVVLLGAGLTGLCTLLARKVVGGNAAFLPGVMFLGFAFPLTGVPTHHWFSMTLVLAAVLVLMERRTVRRLLLAGMLCGCASCFDQPRGAVALLAFAIFLVWERRQGKRTGRSWLAEQLSLAAGFVAAAAAMNAYFVWKAGYARFWYCTVTYVLWYWGGPPWDNWRTYFFAPQHDVWHHLLPLMSIWLLMHCLVPFTYIVFFLSYRRLRRARPDQPWDRLMLLTLTGMFLFLGVFPGGGTLFRLCIISPPALILCSWFLRQGGRWQRAAIVLLCAAAVAFCFGSLIDRQTRWRARLDTPRGRIVLTQRDVYEKYRWALERTHPSDFIFDPVGSDTYFALALRNPTAVPYVLPYRDTLPGDVDGVIEALEKQRVSIVFWGSFLDCPEDSAADHLGPLRAYLRRRYRLVKILSNDEQVWQRRDD